MWNVDVVFKRYEQVKNIGMELRIGQI